MAWKLALFTWISFKVQGMVTLIIELKYDNRNLKMSCFFHQDSFYSKLSRYQNVTKENEGLLTQLRDAEYKLRVISIFPIFLALFCVINEDSIS